MSSKFEPDLLISALIKSLNVSFSHTMSAEEAVMENEFDSLDVSIKRTVFTVISGFFYAIAAQIFWFIVTFLIGTIVTALVTRLAFIGCCPSH